MKTKKSDRAQMPLSFGMIFSIILIIAFLGFTIFVIVKFLNTKEEVVAGKLVEDLQNDVDRAWRGSQGSQEVSYKAPSKTTHVCFAYFSLRDSSERSDGRGKYENLYEELMRAFSSDENLFFYPIGSSEGLDSVKIEHIDIDKITREKNPYCIEKNNGEIRMTIKKDYGDALVVVE